MLLIARSFFVVVVGLQSILLLMLLLFVKISSAGLPGDDGVVVDCKIFFRCCCCFQSILSLMLLLLVGRSFWLSEISFYQLLPCQVWTSTSLTGFIKVGDMTFSDHLLCFSRKSNRNLYTQTMVTLSQPTQLWEQANLRMHNHWGRGSWGFVCFPVHLQGC